MGVYTTAVIGVHLMYRQVPGGLGWQEVHKKENEISRQVVELLREAGVPDPSCDFGTEMDSDIKGVAIGSRMKKIGYFSESNVCHSAIPLLTEGHMAAIHAAADTVGQMLEEVGGFADFQKTVGLAVHGTS
jgi:hypothetical protein